MKKYIFPLIVFVLVSIYFIYCILSYGVYYITLYNIILYLFASPILEEYIFRYIVQNKTNKLKNSSFLFISFGNLFSSILFATIHFLLNDFYFITFLTFFPSLFFGYLYDSYNSLKIPIFFHSFFNINIFILYPSDFLISLFYSVTI